MVRKRQDKTQPVVHVCDEKDGVWASTETIQHPEARLRRDGPKPAMNPEARENQLVNLAVALAERQLIDGTASSAVIVHYLKLASKREHLERMILEKQSRLLEAKTESIAKSKDDEDLAKAALEAMKSYGRSQ